MTAVPLNIWTTVRHPPDPRYDRYEARVRAAGNTFLYLVQCGEGGAIKLGLAARPESRLRALQIASPHELRLLASAPVPRAQAQKIERLFHKELSPEHVRGEWFQPSDRVVRLSIALLTGTPWAEALEELKRERSQ